MKKLLVTLAVLFGSTVLVGRADVVQATSSFMIVVNGSGTVSSLSPSSICLEANDAVFSKIFPEKLLLSPEAPRR